MRRVGCLLVIAQWFVCCLTARASFAESAQFLVDVWGQDDGVPGNAVMGFAQSDEGYLWIVSDLSIARFDGTRFVEAQASELAPTPAEWQGPLRYVRRLFGGGSDAVWLTANNGGLWRWGGDHFEGWFAKNTSTLGFAQVFGVQSNEVVAVTRSGRLLRGRPGAVREILVDACQERLIPETVSSGPGGEIWFLTESGRAGRIDGDGQLSWPWDGGQAPARCLKCHRQGIWLGTEAGLFTWASGCFEAVSPPEVNERFPVRGVLQGRGDAVWVHSGDQAWYRTDGRWYGPLGLWPRSVSAQGQLVDHANRLWLAIPTEGLHCISPDGSHVRLGPDEGLKADSTALFCDAEGSVWTSIYRLGIARIRDRSLRTVRLLDGLHASPLWNIAEDGQGVIWFSPEFRGPARWQGHNLQDRSQSTATGIPPGWTKALTVDRQGRAATAFTQAGVFCFEQGVCRQLLPWPAHAGFTRVLYQDTASVWWMGSDQGLHSWEDDHWKVWGPKDGLPAAPVRAVTEGPDGCLWVATYGAGLARREGRHFVRYSQRNGLPSDSIYTLCPGSDGSLWVGTREGLARWKAGRFSTFTVGQGLPDNRVVQILDDGRGSVWVGTRDGLCRITLASLDAVGNGLSRELECIVYDRDDGLPTRVFQDRASPACWKAQDGRLWFLTAGGAVYCWPDRLVKDLAPPPVRVEAVVIDGQIQQDRSGVTVSESEPFAGVAAVGPRSIHLLPGPHVLEIRYLSPSIAAPERVTYEYKMEGLDRSWVKAGLRQTAVYSVLPPGKYRFRARARNHEGVWGESSAQLALVVDPYLWQRRWFPAAVAAGLAVASVATFAWVQRVRLGRQLARLELQRAKEEERTRISQDLHDHLGSVLTRISMLAEIPAKAAPVEQAVAQQLERIKSNAHEAVGELDALVWVVDPRQDTLASLAGYLASFAEEFVSAAGLTCRVDVPRQYPERAVGSQVRHHLFLAVKEAVHNAVRHADASEILFQITVAVSGMDVTIHDDGIGFDPGKVRVGNGLNNLRERLGALGGSCTVRSQAGKGTAISLSVPLTEISML